MIAAVCERLACSNPYIEDGVLTDKIPCSAEECKPDEHY